MLVFSSFYFYFCCLFNWFSFKNLIFTISKQWIWEESFPPSQRVRQRICSCKWKWWDEFKFQLTFRAEAFEEMWTYFTLPNALQPNVLLMVCHSDLLYDNMIKPLPCSLNWNHLIFCFQVRFYVCCAKLIKSVYIFSSSFPFLLHSLFLFSFLFFPFFPFSVFSLFLSSFGFLRHFCLTHFLKIISTMFFFVSVCFLS